MFKIKLKMQESPKGLTMKSSTAEILRTIQGDSAYKVWLAAGNKGSEQDFLDSLQGKDYVLTSEDKTQIAQQAASMVEVPELPEDTATEGWVKEYAQPKGDYVTEGQLQQAVEDAVKDLDIDMDLDGYATEEWVGQNYQPKGDYLTTANLQAATNNALAQAKSSGEFDGENGLPGAAGKNGVSPTVSVSKSGKVTTIKITDATGTKTATINDGADGKTPVKGTDYVDGKDGVSATHSWNGTTLTVTSASGTSSANLKGDKGDTGASGSNGTSVTVSNVSTSTADGGNNIVTFSDGKTLTVKNGSKGSAGKTPVKGTDYFTEAEKAEMIADVAEANNIGSFKNKKILFMGDSITASSSGWVYHISEILQPSLAVNTAVSGAHWCDYSGTVYDGNPVFDGADNNKNNVIGNQVEKILRGKDTSNANYSKVEDYADFDIIFIAAGTNDSEPTGDIETAFYSSGVVSVGSVDRKTWAGAFRYAVEKLQGVYPNAKIFICTPIQSVAETHTYAETKAKGDYLKRLCSRMSIACIDTMQCGICGIYEVKGANGRDLRDGLHTNDSGALKMAKFNAMCVMNYFEPEILEDTETGGYTNQVPLSTDASGNIYNSTGYRNDTYISTSAVTSYSSKSGYVSTGLIPVTGKAVIRSDGTAKIASGDTSCRIFALDSNKTLVGILNGGATQSGAFDSDGNLCLDLGACDDFYLDTSLSTQGYVHATVAYMRFAMKGTGEGLIITVNEEITD